MRTFYCAVLLWYHVPHTLFFTNQVTLYYSDNLCTNQGATSTSDTQVVYASTFASISERTSVLQFNAVGEQENGAGAKSPMCTGVIQKVLPVLSTETLLHIWLSTEYYGFRPSSTAVDTGNTRGLMMSK